MTAAVIAFAAGFFAVCVWSVLDRIALALVRIADAQEIIAARACLEAERDGLTVHIPDAPPEGL
jgi:hypothetical protein